MENATEKYYRKWIKNIALSETKDNIRRHIKHHAKDLDNSEKNNPLSWVASMHNLLEIYESVYKINSTTEIQLYKLLKKYHKNPRIHTPPPGMKIPPNIKIKKVRASSK
jgi:hypothetical protein